MKKVISFVAYSLLLLNVTTQGADVEYKEIDDKYLESNIVSLDEKKGLSIQTKAGDFLFKPYILFIVRFGRFL